MAVYVVDSQLNLDTEEEADIEAQGPWEEPSIRINACKKH